MYTGPNIIQDEIALMLDPGNSKSYPGSGTTIVDLSGNERNSTLQEGAYIDSNRHIVFEGTGERDSAPIGEHITLNTAATTTSPSLKPNGVTYNVWMVFDGNQPRGHGIFIGRTTRNHMEWRGSVGSGYWRTEARQQNGYSFGASGEDSYGHHKIGKWFNLTLVFDNVTATRPVKWYHNGSLFHTNDMTSGNNPSTEYFVPSTFGRSTGTNRYKYVQSLLGRMGFLVVYDKALTEAEIKQNYNATKSRFNI